MAKTITTEQKEILVSNADAFLDLVEAAASAVAGTAAKRTGFAVKLMEYRDKARQNKEVIEQLVS